MQMKMPQVGEKRPHVTALEIMQVLRTTVFTSFAVFVRLLT